MSFTIATPEQIESMSEHELKKTLRATIRRLKRQDRCLEDRWKDIKYMMKEEKEREHVIVCAVNALLESEPNAGWRNRLSDKARLAIS